MKKLILGLLALLALGSTAVAQTLPASTVVGRLGIGPGPAQAIPFSVLTSNLVGSGSGIFGLTLSGDTNYAMVGTDRTVLINAALTAPRTVTLFAAATLATGQQICVGDAFGGVTSTNTLTITRGGSDTINGATSTVINNAFGETCLTSDGISKWTVGRIQNAGLAQMPANTFKGNNTAAVATPVDLTVAQIKTSLGVVVNVTDPAFGALCNGTGNDATAIQAAIDSLPTNGGIVEIPASNCRITTTINIGNGNSTPTASTRNGIILRGVGNPTATNISGFPIPGGPKITWAGGGSPVIQVQGPLQGWGVQNITIDCASVANSLGIQATGAVYGDSRDLSLLNCSRGVLTNSYPNFGSLHNSWRNVFINVPAIAGAIGTLITGDGAGTTSNTSFDHYENLTIFLPATQTVYGVFLQAADTNYFYNLHCAGGSATATCVNFDYTATGVAGVWPAANMFFGVEPFLGGGGATFGNGGTPGTTSANIIFGLAESNSSACPVINNLACHSTKALVTSTGGNVTSVNVLGAWTTFTPTFVCGTGTFTVNSARRMTMGKTTHIQADVTIATLGTCASVMSFTIPNTSASSAILTGQEVNAPLGVQCKLDAATTNVNPCRKTTLANFVAAERIVVSGIYENQ